ncbi:hypothetical protein A1O7_06904 [Cladophialophora yegresii CBS 114405]|uniref:Uncharacterized protein n=1 Tax=Cladophialophora yegresii CBS 114405 TaxID=1182544 RepID=W9VU66_9EURO|nr:uncharacterized protein A1O7_06904 [Cladophialophora yegresii CBS 114405]EXJ56560.1 hypothetical protein A1O7_06904 [Cladophialophora yegresii CBS 114405]
MATLSSHETMCWNLFNQVNKSLQTGAEHDALDILVSEDSLTLCERPDIGQYHLEIQELTPTLRILVNTTLAIVDPAPDCWQKMEWIGEAKIVLRNCRNLPDADSDDHPLRSSLEAKIRTAEIVLRKQLGDSDELEHDESESCDEGDDEEEEEEDAADEE